MKKKIKRILPLILSICLLSGCGSTKETSDYIASDNVYTEIATFDENSGMSINSVSVDKGVSNRDYSSSTMERVEMDSYIESSVETSSPNANILENNPGAKLIRNVYLDMVTENLDNTTQLIRNKTSEFNGYIEKSETNKRSDYYKGTDFDVYTSNIVVRVPYECVDKFLDSIKGCGVIESYTDNVKDVTLECADLENRIKTLETQHARLIELLAEAENLEVILKLETRLSDVEYDLNSYNLQLKNYNNLTAYSTIRFNIEYSDYIQPEPENKTLLDKMSNALSESFYEIKLELSDFLVNLTYFLPYLAIILIIINVILFVLIFIVKKIMKKFNIKPLSELIKKGKELTKDDEEEIELDETKNE